MADPAHARTAPWWLIGLLGVPLVLACHKHTTDDPDETGTLATTTDASASEPTTAGTTTTAGEACVPNPENWEGILCLKNTADTCGPCDETCQNSTVAGTLAEEVTNSFGCCSVWELETLCGPVEYRGQCCYTVRVTGCGCVDAAPDRSK